MTPVEITHTEELALNAAIGLALRRYAVRLKYNSQLYNDPLGVINDELNTMIDEIDNSTKLSWAEREKQSPKRGMGL